MSKPIRVKLNKDGTLEFAPSKVIKDGNLVFNPDDAMLQELGYKLLMKTTPLPEIEGFVEVVDYIEDDQHVIEKRRYQKFIDPTIGKRKISKIFLKIALIKLGYIKQFEALLNTLQISIGEGMSMSALDAWNDCLTIDEDSEMFKPIINQVKQAFNLTDQQYEDIVKNCISKV